MSWKVLIAHAEGEDDLADLLADPLRQAGYEVAHQGTVLVGESVLEQVSKDHLLFESRHETKPTVSVSYSCEVK